jgi:hypothetical protein
MDEYIGKEALFAEFDRLGLGEHSIVEKVFSDGVRTIIAGMPAADVAPVVRCKDCKYNRGSKKCLNPDSFFAVPKDDDFCSYGERKDGGEHVE